MDLADKWYVMQDYGLDNRTPPSRSLSGTSQQTNYAVSYEAELIGTQDDEEQWYALPKYDTMQSLSSAIIHNGETPSHSGSISSVGLLSRHSLSSDMERDSFKGVPAAVIAGSGVRMSHAGDGLATMFLSQMDLQDEQTNACIPDSPEDDSVLDGNDSVDALRPDPLGQALPDADRAYHAATLFSAHDADIDRLQLQVTQRTTVASTHSSSEQSTDTGTQVTAASVLTSSVAQGVSHVSSQLDSPVRRLLGADYVVAERLLEQLRLERSKIVNPLAYRTDHALQDQQTSPENSRRFDEPMSTYSDDGKSNQAEHVLHDPSFHTLHDVSNVEASSQGRDGVSGVRWMDTAGFDELANSYSSFASISGARHYPNVDNAAHEHNPLSSNTPQHSPDLGIASAVTDFSSPRGGRSMHSGVSTQSSDSARGHQPLIDQTENAADYANADHENDEETSVDSQMSNCSLSTSDSVSSELLRLQCSDDSNHVSRQEQFSISSLHRSTYDMDQDQFGLAVVDNDTSSPQPQDDLRPSVDAPNHTSSPAIARQSGHSPDVPTVSLIPDLIVVQSIKEHGASQRIPDISPTLTTDAMIEQMHRSLGAGTVTPLLPVTISDTDSNESTVVDKSAAEYYNSESRATTPMISSFEKDSDSGSTATSASVPLNVMNNSKAVTTYANARMPAVSPVLPAKHQRGIYDIAHSSGPGSTNRRRKFLGKKPIDSRSQPRFDRHEIYVSQGSGENSESGRLRDYRFTTKDTKEYSIESSGGMGYDSGEIPQASHPMPLTGAPTMYDSDGSGVSCSTDNTDVLLGYPSFLATKIAALRTEKHAAATSGGVTSTKYTDSNIPTCGALPTNPTKTVSSRPTDAPTAKLVPAKDVNNLWERFLCIAQEEEKFKKLQKLISGDVSMDGHTLSANQVSPPVGLPSDTGRHGQTSTGRTGINTCVAPLESDDDYRCKKDAATNCPTPVDNSKIEMDTHTLQPLMLHAWTQTAQHLKSSNEDAAIVRQDTRISRQLQGHCWDQLSAYRMHVPASSSVDAGKVQSSSVDPPRTVLRNKSNDQRYSSEAADRSSSGSFSILQARGDSTQHRRSPRVTLQEALLTSRPDFIARSKQRQLKLREAKSQHDRLKTTKPLKQPKIKIQPHDKRLPSRTQTRGSVWDHLHKPTKRFIDKKDMILENKRKYKHLPEVVNKQERTTKDAFYRNNRLKVKAFDKKVRETRLSRRPR